MIGRHVTALTFGMVAIYALVSCSGAVHAQSRAAPVQEAAPKPAAPIAMKPGDILSGQLNAMRVRAKGKSRGRAKRVATFQLVSQPRRLPPPGDLCNLETGPETFQIITASDAQAAQLRKFVGKQIAVKVGEVACAEAAGVMSEAVVTKWSLVGKP